MIAEIIINRTAKRLNRTFDYKVPIELEELIMIGSTVLVPFGKSSTLEEGYVVGIKENTTYEVKEIVKIKHNLTEKQIELAKWMAKRYFCNVSDCIKQMLTPGTKSKKSEKVIATSKRARQIASGAEVKTKVKEESPVTLAANEIAEGEVEIIEPDEAKEEAIERGEE